MTYGWLMGWQGDSQALSVCTEALSVMLPIGDFTSAVDQEGGEDCRTRSVVGHVVASQKVIEEGSVNLWALWRTCRFVQQPAQQRRIHLRLEHWLLSLVCVSAVRIGLDLIGCSIDVVGLLGADARRWAWRRNVGGWSRRTGRSVPSAVLNPPSCFLQFPILVALLGASS